MKLAEIGEKEQARKMIVEGEYPIQAIDLKREIMDWAKLFPEYDFCQIIYILDRANPSLFFLLLGSVGAGLC
jgi:hypothetical protein